MLLYCIITWLIGIGMGYSFEQQDKEKGIKKRFSLFRVLGFAITAPIILPMGLGMYLGELMKEKD